MNRVMFTWFFLHLLNFPDIRAWPFFSHIRYSVDSWSQKIPEILEKNSRKNSRILEFRKCHFISLHNKILEFSISRNSELWHQVWHALGLPSQQVVDLPTMLADLPQNMFLICLNVSKYIYSYFFTCCLKYNFYIYIYICVLFNFPEFVFFIYLYI